MTVDLIEVLTTAICDELVATKKFQYVPATAQPREIEVLQDGQFGFGVSDVIDEWCLDYDERHKQHTLQLKLEDVLITTLFLETTGVWKGRSRESNGTVLLRPMPSGYNHWKRLANPVTFYETLQVDDGEKSFRYRENLSPQFDWTPYEWDLRDRVVQSELPQSQVAVALIACDRAAYFGETVESLARNPEIRDLPVFAFFDTPDDATKQPYVEQQIEMFKIAIPNGVVIKRPKNFGCGRNIIDARRQLFDNMGYKRVFIFEDDLVVTPNYINYTLNLFNWADARYSNVGAVQGWNWCDLPKSKKIQALDVVQATYTNWWGYCMSSRCWESIRDQVYKFEDLFLRGAYQYRPHESIKAWFRLKMSKSCASVGTKPYLSQPELALRKKSYFDAPATGQDAVTMHLVEAAGWVRLCPLVNRGRYVGQYGIHMTPTMFQQNGFHLIRLDEFDADSSKWDHQLIQNMGPLEDVDDAEDVEITTI